MHLLVLTSNYPNPYFPERTCFFQDYVRIPAQQGHQVGLIALIAVSIKDILGQRRMYFGLRQTEDNRPASYIYLYPTPPKCPQLNRMIRRMLTRRMIREYIARHGRPDLIHAHGLPAGEEARWWHELTGIPYVFTAHSTMYYESETGKYTKILTKVASSAAVCMAVSQGFADLLTALSGRSFISMPNPVDTDFFCPGPLREQKNHPFTFVNVADLKPRKNHAVMIQAFARAFDRHPDYRLLIGGEGVERGRLEHLITDLGLEDRVRLLGHLDRKQILKLLHQGDSFLLSSIHETFGVVLIEAMACGLPVIVTRSHGPEEIITSPELGNLVENNVHDFSQAMQKSSRRDHYENQRRNHVVKNYSFKAIGERLDRIYETLTDGSGSSR